MAAFLLTRYGYPKVPGDNPESIIDVSGPTAYVQLVAGSAGPPIVQPTGGQRMSASAFGLQSLDFVAAMGTASNGLYFVVVVPDLIQLQPPNLPTSLPDGTFGAVRLAWMLFAGGQVAASTNLSTSIIRLFARGH